MPLLEVCLVDDKPMTGYLSAVLKKPDAIVWLRTPAQKQVVSMIESALSNQMTVSFESREIRPIDLEGFHQQCEKILKDYPEHEVQLNVSGGTRLQALIASEIFKAAGKKVIALDCDHNRLIDISTGEYKTFQFNLTVNEYIALHGIKMESGTRFDPEIGKRSNLTFYIGNNLERTVPFIEKCRAEWNALSDPRPEVHWKLEHGGHRFNVSYEPEGKRWHFRWGLAENLKNIEIHDDPGEYFLNGGWLRELVFLRLHRSQYDDVRLNIKLSRDSLPEQSRAESLLDIAMMRGCQCFVFQCFSYPVTKESFFELQAVSETVRLLNARGYIFMSHYPHRGFTERARSSGLELLTGHKITNFSI